MVGTRTGIQTAVESAKIICLSLANEALIKLRPSNPSASANALGVVRQTGHLKSSRLVLVACKPLEEARLVQLVGAGQSHDGASIVEAVKAHHAIVRRPRKNKSSAARNRGAAIAGRRARAEDTWKRHIRSTDRMRKHRTPTDVSRKKTWLQDTGSRNKQEETRKLGWRLLQNTLWGLGGPRSLRATDVIWQTCTNKCKSREWKRAHGRARTFPTKLA